MLRFFRLKDHIRTKREKFCNFYVRTRIKVIKRCLMFEIFMPQKRKYKNDEIVQSINFFESFVENMQNFRLFNTAKCKK